MLLRQLVWLANCLARPNAGRSIDAKIAMMAMTTKSSIRVNPEAFVGGDEWRDFIAREELCTVGLLRENVQRKVGS